MAPPPPDTQHRWSEALYALVSVDTVLDGLKAKIPPPEGLHRLPRPRLLSQLYTAVKVRQYCDLVKQINGGLAPQPRPPGVPAGLPLAGEDPERERPRSRRASLQHRARGQVPRPTPPTLRCLRTQLARPRRRHIHRRVSGRHLQRLAVPALAERRSARFVPVAIETGGCIEEQSKALLAEMDRFRRILRGLETRSHSRAIWT